MQANKDNKAINFQESSSAVSSAATNALQFSSCVFNGSVAIIVKEKLA